MFERVLISVALIGLGLLAYLLVNRRTLAVADPKPIAPGCRRWFTSPPPAAPRAKLSNAQPFNGCKPAWESGSR